MPATPDLPIPTFTDTVPGALDDHDLDQFLDWVDRVCDTDDDISSQEIVEDFLINSHPAIDDGALPAIQRVEPWTIEGDGAAEWAARKIAECRARINDADQLYAEWTSRIEDWFVDATKRDRASIVFFEHHLNDYALRRRQTTGQATGNLPSVTLKTRKVPAGLSIDDDTAAYTSINRILGERVAVDEGIVKVTRKVQVGQLRDHTIRLHRQVGWRANLVCGHHVEIVDETCAGQEDETELMDRLEAIEPSIGDFLECAACNGDDDDMELRVEGVEPVTVELVMLVDSEDVGHRVDGVSIVPEYISPKVEIR